VTVEEIIALVDEGSYFSRSASEVLKAINSAQKSIYLRVLNETNRGRGPGFFLKFDTASVTMTTDVEEITLPSDCDQLLRVRERQNSADRWRIVPNAELNDPSVLAAEFVGVDFYDGEASRYQYIGPYLDAAAAATEAKIEKLRWAPIPTENRLVELVYTAKLVQITNGSQVITVPEYGHDAIVDLAVAELLGLNGDAGEASKLANGEKKVTEFLTWVRARSLQDPPRQEPYL